MEVRMNNAIKINKEKLMNRIEESGLFTNNFGTFSKSDYELLMFTVYLDSIEGEVRSSKISKDLGITESKVRNLRIKSQLLYPRKIELEKELKNAIKNGYYDDLTRTIKITIDDPSVQIELKNMIEENNGCVDLALNSKQLVLSIKSLLIIASVFDGNTKEVLKELNNKKIEEDSYLSIIEKKPTKEQVKDYACNTVTILNSLLQLYTTGQPILKEIINLINVFLLKR